MINFKNLLVGVVIVAGLGVIYLVMSIFKGDSNYTKVFDEYQNKGKTTQFKFDDVRKGFN